MTTTKTLRTSLSQNSMPTLQPSPRHPTGSAARERGSPRQRTSRLAADAQTSPNLTLEKKEQQANTTPRCTRTNTPLAKSLIGRALPPHKCAQTIAANKYPRMRIRHKNTRHSTCTVARAATHASTYTPLVRVPRN